MKNVASLFRKGSIFKGSVVTRIVAMRIYLHKVLAAKNRANGLPQG
jgi:hypothetical protein